MRKKNYALRYVAGQPAKRIFPPDLLLPVPHLLPEGIKLPAYPTLKLLVWNIFKQQRADWLTVLKKYGDHCHLILLQEAQTTPELIDFATENYSSVDQVPALNLPQHASGVMSLARTTPIFCCPLREKEPLLRLAKSALITVYPMPDGQLLMVANVHAINFSLGIEAYRKQLAALGELLKTHQGPVLLGGDFNAWSRQRSHILYRFIRKQSLKEVNFSDDYRKTAFGRPLDFVFYRDLKIKHSQVIETNASDHNPLYVEFEY